MENYHIFHISPVHATSTKPARVKIRSERFRDSLIIGYTNEPGGNSPARDTAINFLSEKGFVIIGEGESHAGLFLISETFKSLK